MAVVTKVLDRTLAVLTQGVQSWAEAASITLTENGEWLVLCSFELGIDSTSINVEARLQQDDSDELQYGRLEDVDAAASYKSWFWMTRVTRDGSDVLLDLDFEPIGTATARIRNRVLMALKLDDIGTEDTDWRWQNVDAEATNIDATWENADGVLLTETWTPGSSEDWLIIACCELRAGATNNNGDARLSLNDEASTYDMCTEEGEDVQEWRFWASIRLLSLPTSEQKFEIQTRSDSAASADARRARFFAVRKAVFDQAVEFRADAYAGPSGADAWEEKLDAYFTPNQQEDVLILGHCGIKVVQSAWIDQTRVHEEETDELMHYENKAYDITDILTVAFADIKNWTAALKAADLDIRAGSTIVEFGDACVIFVSLTLAAAGAEYSLEIGAGSYAVTGAAAGFPIGRVMGAAAGSYAVTGAAVDLLRDLLMAAAAGSYSLTGAAVSFPVDRVIGAGAGSYSLTGATVALLRDLLISAAAGSYTLTGAAVDFLRGKIMTAEGGSYVITGSDVTLLKALIMAATGGTFTLTGTAVDLLYGKIMAAEGGSYVITGSGVDLLKAMILDMGGGTYVLTGQTVDLALVSAIAARYALHAEKRSFALTPERSFDLHVPKRSFGLTAEDGDE